MLGKIKNGLLFCEEQRGMKRYFHFANIHKRLYSKSNTQPSIGHLYHPLDGSGDVATEGTERTSEL